MRIISSLIESYFLATTCEADNTLKLKWKKYLSTLGFARFRKFLTWLGTPPAVIRETKPGTFCKIVSEFALEYRTTRDRVLQQLEKKASHRERNKTRGKMITDVANAVSFLSP